MKIVAYHSWNASKNCNQVGPRQLNVFHQQRQASIRDCYKYIKKQAHFSEGGPQKKL